MTFMLSFTSVHAMSKHECTRVHLGYCHWHKVDGHKEWEPTRVRYHTKAASALIPIQVRTETLTAADYATASHVYVETSNAYVHHESAVRVPASVWPSQTVQVLRDYSAALRLAACAGDRCHKGN